MKKKYIVLSVHDVTPEFKSELSEIVTELSRRGFDKKCMCVVPNYGLRNDILGDGRFIDWLHSLNGNGDEVVLHGFSHFSDKRRYKSFLEFCKGELFALGEAEFQNLSYEEAMGRIKQGRDTLRKVGLDATGFIAPCWITNSEAERAIKDAGFGYMVSAGRVRDLIEGVDIKTKTFFFSSKTKVLYLFDRAYDFYLEKIHLINNDVATIPIHPRNIREGKSFEHCLDVLERLRRDGRELITYSEFLKLRRQNGNRPLHY